MASDGSGLNSVKAISTGRSAPDARLLSALAGKDADCACSAASRAARVVKASLGVLRDQRATTTRSRAVALAVTVLVPLMIGPFVWWAVQELLVEGHLNDPGSQLALWVCMLCPALAAAVLVAGWMHRRN